MKSKKELRTEFRAKRKAIENKNKKSLKITEKILSLPQVKKADSLFIFYPLENEVDLLPIVEYALKEGKKLGFPLCEDKDGSMTFRLVRSLDELENGLFGIKEPKRDAPEIFPKNTVIFLPALAIDKNGCRLGYGKGYYDRYLARYAHFEPYTVGVIFSDLLTDTLPTDEYDIPCDAVISENGIQ